MKVYGLFITLCVASVVSGEAFSVSGSRHFDVSTVSSSLSLTSRFSRGVTTLQASEIGDSPEALEIRGGDTTSSKPIPLIKELVAEFLGTFLIVQLGTGSVMSAIFTDSLVGLFQIASVWIIAVTVAICTTSSISGAHLNPAVSIAFALVRPKSFNWKKILPFSLAQLGGAVAGSGLNLALYSGTIAAYENANNIVRASTSGLASAKAFGEYFAAPVTNSLAFLVEAVGTGILSFVIFALTNEKNKEMESSGLIPPLIGLTVGALIAVMAPLTQAGFNPARDFGPRIVAFLAGWKTVAFQKWWVYVLAPIIGATSGAVIADKVLYAED